MAIAEVVIATAHLKSLMEVQRVVVAVKRIPDMLMTLDLAVTKFSTNLSGGNIYAILL